MLAIDLKSRLDKRGDSTSEPLAVVGIGCEFPGASGPDEFWQRLEAGDDLISEIPAARWNLDSYYHDDPDVPGKMITRYGGFVGAVDHFDHDFFGISKREANMMDPQQRLLLEVTWQTLENANIDPDSLRDSQTGVFVGICNSDFFVRQTAADLREMDMYISTGAAHSVASGRLSYTLGLRGPAVSVDTACSSSLVAVHLACQSLRAGECRMALAGGVNLVLLPEITVSLSQASMLSPDGRCKAFDEAANGFVRGEGAGMLALKRLSDAQADGDAVLALIHGSATNQDGRSHGLTAPNGPSQEAVIRSALASAKMEPDQVTLIEAHGTGTSLGDPIEARALANVFGKRSVDAGELVVGSVKSNIGHAESAAGVAGLIKLVMCANRGQIPKSLHYNSLNPHIDWDGLPIHVAATAEDWNTGSEPRVGGVSSFGFSGSNAHVIVGSPPTAAADNVSSEHAGGSPGLVLTLSAQSEAALADLASRYARLLADSPSSDLASLCAASATQRAHFSYRAALPAESQHQLQSALESLALGNADETVAKAYSSSSGVVKPVFMFPGQGSQYAGMTHSLYQSNAAYASALDECAELVGTRLQAPLLDVLFARNGQDAEQINDTAMTQVGIFCVEYAMARMFQSSGVQPGLLIGHSIGEYAAACIAGVFTLSDAVSLVIERGRLCGELPATGMMAAVFADEDKLAEILADSTSVSVAASNAPGSIVLSGEKTALERILAQLLEQGISSRPLNISNAFHSPAIEPVVGAYRTVLEGVTFSAPRIPMVSNVSGEIAEASTICAPDYWCRHLREPVRFMQGMNAALATGHKVFLEAGAHPVLSGLAMTFGADATFIPTLRRDEDDQVNLRRAWQHLYVAGCALNWNQVLPQATSRVNLPNYPFQRVRCWPDDLAIGVKPGEVASESRGFKPERLQIAGADDVVFQVRLQADNPSYLKDHQVFDKIIMPSPAYLEMAAAAACCAHDLGTDASVQLGSLSLTEALVFPENKDLVVQTRLVRAKAGLANFEILAATDSRAPLKFLPYARGTVSVSTVPRLKTKQVDLEALKNELPVSELRGDLYPRMRALGLQFGPDFQCLASSWNGEGRALGLVELPANLRGRDSHYCMHPALLDSCFHLLGALIPQDSKDPFLLMGIESILIDGEAPEQVFALATARPAQTQDMVTADMEFFDNTGRRFATVGGIELRRATVREFADAKTGELPLHYQLEWREDPNQQGVSHVDGRLSPEVLASELKSESASLIEQHRIDDYERSLGQVEERAAHYVQKAFADLGWRPAPGDTIDPETLRRTLGVEDQHSRLFRRLLTILAEIGVLEESDSGFSVILEPGIKVSPPSLASDHDIVTNCSAELDILDRCASELANVLTGATDPIGLLFPGGDFSAVEALYKDAPYALACNRLVGLAVEKCVAHTPDDRKLRILEIGAGTGSTTSQVLEHCDPNNTEYVFTDLSPLFLERAQERFDNYTFVRYEIYNVEESAAEQGLELGQFDIIIAANVLHATSDLTAVMNNVADLLKTDGSLLAIEGTRATRWVDLTFGYTDGWWRFSDTELRPHHALLTRSSWDTLLQECGFLSAGMLGSNFKDPSQEVLFGRLQGKPDTKVAGDREIAIIGSNDLLREQLAVALGASFSLVHQATSAKGLGSAMENVSALLLVPGPENFDLSTAAGDALDCSEEAIAALKALESNEQQARLFLLTRGAQKLGNDECPDPVQSVLWGLGRVMSLEHPERFGALIDMDPEQSIERTCTDLVNLLCRESFEDQIALRRGQTYLARLIRSSPDPIVPKAFSSTASYLVTGGLGGLGLEVGRWLASQGAGQIVLISRRQLPPEADWSRLPSNSDEREAIEAIEFMREQGANVHVVSADIVDPDAIGGVFKECQERGHPVAGVIHSAVAMSEAPIVTLDRASLKSMYDAKIQGTLNLNALCEQYQTEFLALFSSTTALLGVAGLGHYAAANQFLDALAQRTGSGGHRVVSINWGTWEVMRVASDDDRQRFEDAGLVPLNIERALHELHQAIAGQDAQYIVADVRWETLKAMYEVRRPRHLLDELTQSAESESTLTASVVNAEGSLAKLSGLSGEKQREALVEIVSSVAAQVLGSSASVRPERGFFDMGMDSLMAVELKTRLESQLESQLPSTLTFNYPTIDAVVDFLRDDLFERDEETPEAEPDTVAPQSTDTSGLSDDELSQKLADKLKNLGLD
ncbi:MAG: SDR family NAD(P)-dependent oxidoreductase [Pseudomonadota bacterium]